MQYVDAQRRSIERKHCIDPKIEPPTTGSFRLIGYTKRDARV